MTLVAHTRNDSVISLFHSEIIENIESGIVLIDSQKYIIYCNEWVEKRCGYYLGSIRNNHIRALSKGELGERIESALEQAIKTKQTSYISHSLNKHPFALYKNKEDSLADKRLKQQITIKPLHDGHCVIHITDVSASSRREGLLKNQSTEKQKLIETHSNMAAEVRAILQSAMDGILVFDSLLRMETYNPAALDIFRYSKHDFPNIKLDSLISDINQHIRQRLSAEFSQEQDTFEGIGWRASGDEFPIEISIGYRKSSDGHEQHILIVRDISSRKLIEEKIHREKEIAQVTLRSITNAVVTTDSRGYVTSLNRVAEEMAGWSETDAIGNKLSVIINSSTNYVPDEFDQMLNECLTQSDERSVERNGSIIFSVNDKESINDFYMAPIKRHNTKIIGAVIAFHDVTKARKMAEELSWQAYHDPLTKLPNRRKFEKDLIEAKESLSDSDESHCLMYADLDQFKIVNDTCGHHAGDELLKQIISTLKDSLRDSDIVARLGGDEFGILLKNCPPEKSVFIAEKVRQNIQDFQFIWDRKSFNVGISIGLVTIDCFSRSIVELLSAADAACYAAKESGRNKVHVYDNKDDEANIRHTEMRWAADIPAAITDNRLVLARQDILALNSNKIEHCEVLVRMRDSDDSLIPPGVFLPAAERFNYMPLIDKWVAKNTFNYILDSEDDNKQYNINISGISFSDENFLEFLISELRSREKLVNNICFEITETAAISNLKKAIEFINHLRHIGCKFALDDFGSGLSSFSYLKNLPVDYLKIDGQFIKNIKNDAVDLAMVSSINDIGHTMKIKTVAEFVEDEETLNILRKLGIDYAQGYHIHKPEVIVS